MEDSSHRTLGSYKRFVVDVVFDYDALTASVVKVPECVGGESGVFLG